MTGAPAAVTARVVDVVAGAALTVTASCVLSIRAPEEPVITTVAFPGVAELLAVSVSKLVPVEIGFGAKVAVTPAGNPCAARLTLPANPNCGDKKMVDVPEPPSFTLRLFGEAESMKAGGLIVSASVVPAVRLPEVPVMVTVAVPGAALLVAVSVSKLVPVDIGFGANVAVTPAGSPDAARLTLPVNPDCGDKKMVDVTEPPSFILRLPGES